MTKDQKALILFQLDNIIDLSPDLKPEKVTELLEKVRACVDELKTGSRKMKEDENPLLAPES